MAKEKETKVAPLLTTNKQESAIDRPVESMGITPFGELFSEVITSPKGKKFNMSRYIHRLDGENKVCIPINLPPSFLEPDMLYPYRELRMTQTRFNDMDYVNSDGWVKEPLKDDNSSLIRDASGQPINQFFWCKLKIMALKEEDECKYGPVQYILGSDITKYTEAKQIVGGSMVNTTRQRVEDEDEVRDV